MKVKFQSQTHPSAIPIFRQVKSAVEVDRKRVSAYHEEKYLAERIAVLTVRRAITGRLDPFHP
jgi:hypothetical protein